MFNNEARKQYVVLDSGTSLAIIPEKVVQTLVLSLEDWGIEFIHDLSFEL